MHRLAALWPTSTGSIGILTALHGFDVLPHVLLSSGIARGEMDFVGPDHRVLNFGSSGFLVGKNSA